MPKAIDVAHVVYQVTDLDRMETFMQDFGLVAAERRPTNSSCAARAPRRSSTRPSAAATTASSGARCA